MISECGMVGGGSDTNPSAFDTERLKQHRWWLPCQGVAGPQWGTHELRVKFL